ncbi:MAG: DUF2461 family protein [Chitinophagaceae bacterium]|nr:MAG: DUF2461 family protein [Chitinophagaceae bacterium]
MLKRSTLSFLSDLAAHNDRSWFLENRDSYDMARADVLALTSAIIKELNLIDPFVSVDTDPKKASTWNYQSVQVRGKINLLDPDQTRQALKDLTELSEPSLSSPAAFQHMDSVYIDKNLKAITGFEILVRDIRHVYKLSQDHSKENRKSIINDLESRNDQASHYIAQQMKIGLDDHGITNS